MNEENYRRLNELSLAREKARPYNANVDQTTIAHSAKNALWIKASVYLSDEIAEKMIADFERGIIEDVIYYSNKVES